VLELVVVDGRPLERSAAHAVRPVAGGHKLGLEHPLLALADVANGRHRSVDADRLGFEADVAARVEARLDQVYDDLLLAVDEDRPPDERVEVDVVAAAVEVEVDAAMDERFAIHPPSHARRPQELRCAVLQHARAHPRLRVAAIALFQHDRPDAADVQQVGEEEAGRSRPDDRDLGAVAQRCASSRSRSRSTRTRRRILPEGDFGIASTNSTSRTLL
jgi:hypothetical protein